MLEVFLIHGTDQGVERLEGGTTNPVPPRIGIDREKHDGRLAAHCAELSIEPQRVPGAPIELGAQWYEGV